MNNFIEYLGDLLIVSVIALILTSVLFAVLDLKSDDDKEKLKRIAHPCTPAEIRYEVF